MKHIVELKVRLVYELPDDFTNEHVRFHLEENLCADNYINQLAGEVEVSSQAGLCATCYRASAEVIGEYCGDEKELQVK